MSNVREGYTWWPQQGVRQMFLCDLCGAAVADTKRHADWHEWLLNVFRVIADSAPVRD